MSEKLVIVFVKNILLGKVKTRLAKTIGDYGAFEVYKTLVDITEKETSQLQDCDLRIYFSDVIIDSKWPGAQKFVQNGSDLGEKMYHAFEKAFEDGYDKVIGVGSDLPDLNKSIIDDAFMALSSNQTVFGPAEDGGYFLLGMSSLYDYIFVNKSWSTETLLKETLSELDDKEISYQLLKQLNDVDTLDDLKRSSVSEKFEHLYELSRSNKRSI